MSYMVLGDCSICGGRVTVPTVWHGIYPPDPTCQSCGAVARGSDRKVIDMKPARNATLADLDMLDHMRNRGMTQAEAEARGLA